MVLTFIPFFLYQFLLRRCDIRGSASPSSTEVQEKRLGTAFFPRLCLFEKSFTSRVIFFVSGWVPWFLRIHFFLCSQGGRFKLEVPYNPFKGLISSCFFPTFVDDMAPLTRPTFCRLIRFRPHSTHIASLYKALTPRPPKTLFFDLFLCTVCSPVFLVGLVFNQGSTLFFSTMPPKWLFVSIWSGPINAFLHPGQRLSFPFQKVKLSAGQAFPCWQHWSSVGGSLPAAQKSPTPISSQDNFPALSYPRRDGFDRLYSFSPVFKYPSLVHDTT